MRLLQVLEDGCFVLTKNFLAEAVPPYGILSHRWESDDEEVSYLDIRQGVGHEKRGFEKLKFCRDRALGDKLQYFWVDSCCIDRSKALSSPRPSTRCFGGMPMP